MAFAQEPVVVFRHITPAEKYQLVTEWLAYRDTCRGPGGMGYPDPSIFPLTDALNALDGVVTTQSCAGHRLIDARDGGAYIQPGQLWLRTSADLEGLLITHAPALLSNPRIQCIDLLFKPWGNVWNLIFDGDECGGLAESASAILDFFTPLSVRARW